MLCRNCSCGCESAEETSEEGFSRSTDVECESSLGMSPLGIFFTSGGKGGLHASPFVNIFDGEGETSLNGVDLPESDFDLPACTRCIIRASNGVDFSGVDGGGESSFFPCNTLFAGVIVSSEL